MLTRYQSGAVAVKVTLCVAVPEVLRVLKAPTSAFMFHAYRLWKLAPVLMSVCREKRHEPSALFAPAQVEPVVLPVDPLNCAAARRGADNPTMQQIPNATTQYLRFFIRSPPGNSGSRMRYPLMAY